MHIGRMRYRCETVEKLDVGEDESGLETNFALGDQVVDSGLEGGAGGVGFKDGLGGDDVGHAAETSIAIDLFEDVTGYENALGWGLGGDG